MVRRAALFVAAGAALVIALLARPNRVVRAPGEVLTFVEEGLPFPRDQVLAAVGRAFPHYDYTRPRASWTDYCYLHPFQVAQERTMDPGSDPALLRFLALSPERKRYDLWLACDSAWASEYQSPRGEPLPFTTSFIIHVEPASERATRVEVVEYFPYVTAGKKLGFRREALPLPWWILDHQRVAPTTRDRLHLLNRIRQALPQM